MNELCNFCKMNFDIEDQGFRAHEGYFCSAACLHKGSARHTDFFKKINIERK